MTKIYLLTDIVIVSAIIVICAIPKCNGVISDKRLCYNPECSEPVSIARTMVRYSGIEAHMLSFPSNTEVVIYSKGAGKRKDLWGAKINGKRGYIAKHLIKEYKILQSQLLYEVPTELVENEVNATDELVVDGQSNPNDDVEQVDVEVNSTVIDESQNLNDIQNVEVEVNNATADELEIMLNPEKLESETVTEELSLVVEPSNSNELESGEQSQEKISEVIQGVTPPYEVIDGTAIPLLNEEIPIKPSFSTPIIAATATSEEEPILSVHPSFPSTIRPLISRFSNSESQVIVEDNHKAESNIFAENLTGESDSEKQSLPVQVHIDDTGIDETELSKESTIENNHEIEIQGVEGSDGSSAFIDIAQPTQNTMENSEMIINNVEIDENNNVKLSDNTIEVDNSKIEDVPAVEAAGSYASDTTTDQVNQDDTISDDSKNENVISNADLSDDITQTDVDNNTIQEAKKKSDSNGLETMQSQNEHEEPVQDQQELKNSAEQTEYLSDKNIIDTNKEIDGSNNVEETKVPLNSKTVQQLDDQAIVTNGVMNDENITVHNVQVETKIENDSENNSHVELLENYSPLDIFNPANKELSTEQYSSLEDEKPTTTRSLLAVEEGLQGDENQSNVETMDTDKPDSTVTELIQEYENESYIGADLLSEVPELDTTEQSTESTSFTEDSNPQVAPFDTCDINSDCTGLDNESSPNEEQNVNEKNEEEENQDYEDDRSYSSVFEEHNYLETLLYLSITAFTTLLFSLGYYYIENQRRDQELVAKINILEKELLVTTKESMMLKDGLQATKHKLDSIEDESFGSNEMVLSLKADLEVAQITKGELEDQIITLEKELESATEAGLELERMLREFLASQSDENPLAQSVEDLQTRLNAQQATNESLTNSLNLKSQENEALTSELALAQQKCQQLEVELTRLSGELKIQSNFKNNVEKEFSTKVSQLNEQVNRLSGERADLIKQLASKEMALNDLSEVIKQSTDNLDFEKLYHVSHIKAEAQLVIKERDELKIKLTEVEGAHELLEEHMKLIKEEIASVTEQYELAERDKTEAQTRLEVLSNYFKDKENQLQKELGMQEAMWVQKQGEVTSTVERIQTMQNEIQNYRQQIETLKREILDQEREYRSQIATLETKSHEQWVIARQSERRLEESKAEASQLRNRLTMVEKSINEVDSDVKIHRLETNGEMASSPQLFMGAETSSSPILFAGSSGVPPLPPSYMYGAPLPPPFIPPPPHSGGGPMYDISRRPPPLGGRLSSPPPIPPLHRPPGRYEDASSPPPPLSPPLHPPYNHRSPPPPFSNERIHPHPPPPFLPPLGTSHSWGDESLPPVRNPVFHPHQQREQRVRNHRGSLHSSGDSLDKTNHTGKS